MYFLPSPSWLDAADNNLFMNHGVSKEESKNFKFNREEIVKSNRGYGIFRPYEIDDRLTLEQHARKYGLEIGVGGDGIQIEKKGVGCTPHQSVDNCFAFSFIESYILVTIDLVKSGIHPWVLDHVRPLIIINQSVNHRYDCSAVVGMMARLDSTREWEQLGEEQKSNRVGIVSKRWKGWQTANWEKMTVQLDKYPSGMRFLKIVTAGRDNQFWKGFYGPKVANLEVQIVLPIEPLVEGWNPDGDYFDLDEMAEAIEHID